MPFHRFYVPEGLYTEEDKTKLSQSITEFYTGTVGLAAFYVVVVFIEIKKDSYYVGGKANGKFVRVAIQHWKPFETYEVAKGFMDMYEGKLAPFIKDRGLDWEVAIEIPDRNLTRLGGFPIPLKGSEGEKLWVRVNKAVPYE
ncbi:putative oxalocrotonate tautomerase enzyme domain-containing protein [Ditylenchus destructor]|nr:putative oxalocrotonate tautomerase enzyme domain-containing protein [Ditylenchus destructor]